MASSTGALGMWGNSSALRLPAGILKSAGFEPGDAVRLDSEDGRIVISRIDSPKAGTLEYLFKDYAGEPFASGVLGLGGPVGNERW
ncbi:MAG: AbrB/MazE/SpoVT family DNA-binding domain-containing protein [Clostridiales bacterium]|nr:AbrB/MazE/SpoVT family DNA-binding domain-containing protein [Clostridiales bacterium]